MSEFSLKEILSDQHRNSKLSHDEILFLFLDHIKNLGIELYPAQEEALIEIYEGNNLILNTPTGSGKSMVALGLHFLSLLKRRRSFYTSPIKALVNEKFLSLCYFFGADHVGLITGDASVNQNAPIICCTAEILSNMALKQGAQTAVDDVIIDEFHFYADPERGTAWQIPLLTLPHCRFLLMSATMGDCSFFEKELTDLTGLKTKTVSSKERPVPLDFRYQEIPIGTTLENLVALKRTPVYVVNFTQRECAQVAQNLMSQNFCTKEEKQAINEFIKGEDFPSPYGKEISKFIRHGVGIHHAGLLPRYRILIEKLAQKGFLKIIVGTDTLGVGVNIPIKTVLFTKLCKFNGEKVTLLNVRDFHQISGRAGRKGFDDQGYVVALAPEYIIENKVAEEKAKKSLKNKKIVKAKPPEKGFIPWNEQTFQKLIESPPEPLKSSFQINHGMLLNVLSRSSNGCLAMKELIRRCHESNSSKKRIKSKAFELFRSLVERKIIEFTRPENSNGSYLRLNVDLQNNFSLHQSLALYLIDAILLIDPYSEDYALKILTLAESICENPQIILQKQIDRAKSELVAQLKEEGIEYEKRMEKLEEVTYPKPMSDFIYNSFNDFSKNHPWVGHDNIRPKSIAREMFENCMSFNDYIKEYQIERSEGILLRYLTETYKVLTQTIPQKLKTAELEEIIFYIKSNIHDIDSSLIDEWEKIKNPEQFQIKKEAKKVDEEKRKEEMGILYDLQEFNNRIRNQIHRFIRFLSLEQFENLIEMIENREEWSLSKLENILDNFYETHQSIKFDNEARNKKYTHIIQQKEDSWEVEQTIVDEDQLNDWIIHFKIDILRCKKENKVILTLSKISSL